MIICIEPDDGLTAFERKYLFTEAKGDKKKNRKNVRQIDIDLSNDKPKTRINGNTTDADDIDLDDTEDVDLSELDDAAAASDTSIEIEPPDEDDPNADIDDVEDDDSDDIAIDDTSDDISTDSEDTDTSGDDSETVVTANTAGEDSDGGDDIVTEPDDDTDSSNDSTDDTSDDSDSDSGDDSGSDNGSSDDIAIEPDNGEDSSGDDSGSDDQSSSDSGDSGDGDDSSESPEDKEEALHKQALFSKFQNLYTSISTYNTKLDGIVGKTDDTNRQYREINDNLKQVKDFLYDYMVIRFKDVSYTESMLFYQRAIAVVNLSMDQLETVKKSERDK